MVTISIVASGSRGDVQPYVALGNGLKVAGYNVRLLASDDFEQLVTDAGLAFASTGESVEAILQSDEWRKVTESGNFLKILAKMQAEMKHRAVGMAGQLPALLEGSDFIVAGMAGMGGVYSYAEHFNIPVLQAYVFPFTPTQAFHSPLVPRLPFGSVLNRLSFHVTRQMFWQNTKIMDNLLRRALHMRNRGFWGPFKSLNDKHIPALYGYSPHVLPRPNDWADNHLVMGYWFLDAAADWAPPSDLMDFLDAGEPPVYIGFGSMGNRNPQEAGQIALNALERSGQRGILATGWGGLSAANLPKHVHLISSIPHTWLFPRMAAVVHHGGAGTTAAGLRAGVPSIIVPFMGDQPFWGKRVADLGVGPTPIPRKKLTGARLGEAITEAITNTAMRRKASDLGEKLRAEDGVGEAVRFIDHCIKQSIPLHSQAAALDR